MPLETGYPGFVGSMPETEAIVSGFSTTFLTATTTRTATATTTSTVIETIRSTLAVIANNATSASIIATNPPIAESFALAVVANIDPALKKATHLADSLPVAISTQEWATVAAWLFGSGLLSIGAWELSRNILRTTFVRKLLRLKALPQGEDETTWMEKCKLFLLLWKKTVKDNSALRTELEAVKTELEEEREEKEEAKRHHDALQEGINRETMKRERLEKKLKRNDGTAIASSTPASTSGSSLRHKSPNSNTEGTCARMDENLRRMEEAVRQSKKKISKALSTSTPVGESRGLRTRSSLSTVHEGEIQNAIVAAASSSPLQPWMSERVRGKQPVTPRHQMTLAQELNSSQIQAVGEYGDIVEVYRGQILESVEKVEEMDVDEQSQSAENEFQRQLMAGEQSVAVAGKLDLDNLPDLQPPLKRKRGRPRKNSAGSRDAESPSPGPRSRSKRSPSQSEAGSTEGSPRRSPRRKNRYVAGSMSERSLARSRSPY